MVSVESRGVELSSSPLQHMSRKFYKSKKVAELRAKLGRASFRLDSRRPSEESATAEDNKILSWRVGRDDKRFAAYTVRARPQKAPRRRRRVRRKQVNVGGGGIGVDDGGDALGDGGGRKEETSGTCCPGLALATAIRAARRRRRRHR